MRTPLGNRLEVALLEERRRMANEWFFKWHHIGSGNVAEIDSFDGRVMKFGGIRFEGSPRQLYWDAIQRYLRSKIVETLKNVELEIAKYPIKFREDMICEAEALICRFASDIRQSAVEKDRILRGDGVNIPAARDLGEWRGSSVSEIQERIEYLRNIYLMEGWQIAESAQYGGPTTNVYVRDSASVNEIIVHNSNNSVWNSSKESIEDLILQIRGISEKLPSDIMDKIVTDLKDIEMENASSRRDDRKIEGKLKSIKSIAEGAAGDLVAGGVSFLISKILGL